MKKIALTIIAIITLILISSCNQGIFQNNGENKKGSGKLTVSINENIMRTILPTFGTVSQYDISGTGPDSQTFSLTNTGTTKQITDLLVGSWAITVTGKDGSNNVIVKGTATTTVVENQSTPVAVTVNYLQEGTGSVNITIDWDVSVSVDSVMFQIGTDAATEIYTSGNSVNYTNNSATSGAYLYSFKLKRAGVLIANVFESVHIYDFHNTAKTITLATTDFNSKPTAPTGLSASEGTGKIVLNWTDTSKLETGFVVERSTTAGSGFAAIGGTDTTPLAANTITYDDTTAANGTTYYYRVLAKNSFGSSASGEASGKLEPPVPGNSGIFTLNGVTATGITVNWTAATDNTTSQTNLQYLVYRSTSNNLGSVANCEANGTAVGTFTANITTKAVTGLTSGTTYYFNVVVKDEAGNKTCYTANSSTTLTPSNNANLSALTISSGTLSPAFASGTTSYVDKVTNGTTSVTVTPTREHAGATIQVKVNDGSFTAVTSGSPSGSLSLNIGSNHIHIKVTAEDGTTTKTYMINVVRANTDAYYYEMVDAPSVTNFSMGYTGVAELVHIVPLISAFKMGKYEVTYEQWYDVYQWTSPTTYYFANAGREGHDGTVGAAPVTCLEPVTTVNWRDVMVWCNKASEREGLTPVYYTDAGFTTPLRDSRDGSYGSSINTTAGSFDNPFVKWDANGYRLPTEATHTLIIV